MDFFKGNYDYDIIIVGGGISGLFTAYKLSNTDQKILLIEMHEELGGRVHTIYKTDFYFECAAARFHKKHTKLLSLINELELKDKIVPLPKKIDTFLRNKKTTSGYNTKENLDLKYLLEEAVNQKNEIDKKKLMSITFYQYLMAIYDSETVNFIKDSFGYDSEILELNAHAAMKMYNKDLFSDDDYYVLDGGLSQIIEKMESELKLKENVFIKRKTKVVDIDKGKLKVDNGDKYNYEKLILTIPSEKLKKIDHFEEDVSFDSVKSINLLRIYAKYPTKNLWFKGMKRTITDNYIRNIIPINEEAGLIMISYTDGIYAEMWDRYNQISEKFLITMLHKEINSMFGIDPPKPEFLSTHYWENGIHLWKPGFDMDEEYDKMLKPYNDQEIYIFGESFSKKQGWIEGTLETCHDVLKMLKIKGYNIEEKKNDVGDLKKKKKVDKKKDDKKKKYTIDEVLKNDTWIVLDHNGEKPIYDVKRWIPQHPGGSAIKKGIEANKHYKNPDKHKQSPYEMWEKVHNKDILKKMILKENNLIEYVGDLK